ncbi:MAG: response regulator [Desulfuromonadales bacterium]|nr:response regulator [Desulfuromonadales bacterium]
MKKHVGKILVMDDEIVVSVVAGEMLEYLGYDVTFARDGHQALDMYSDALATGSPFDVVIMDLTIPDGMGGKDAIEKIREVDPNVRAIVSSGYSNDPVMADFRSYGFTGVVVKPYNLEELGEQVSKALQG